MEDTAQCVVISHPLGPSPEQEVADKIKENFHDRNTQGLLKNRLFEKHGIDTLLQIAVGPSAVGILLESGEVIRLSLLSKTHQMLPPPSNPPQPANNAAQATLRGSVPKFRRVMLSASSFRRGERGGVVIDSRRPVIPASSVPEDLIAQAQVVLQGKSREVIVRELQRTNLNVNEAVNNLLSRDDDDEDDEGGGHGEVMLPEELISLLDPSSQHPLLEAADLYGADFEYILGRDRRRNEKEKEKKSKDNSGSATPTSKNKVDLDDTVEYWAETKGVPEGVDKFTMISATGTELLAVSDKGVLYSWPWSEAQGETDPHPIATRLIPADEEITNIATSRLRIVILLKSLKMGSWLDHRAVGDRVCQATEVKPSEIDKADTITQLAASNNLAVARTKANSFYWCGFYPFNDRPKLLEKERSKSKKHVTFDTGSNEIKEGSEVRTKATPIYAAGSVAVNISTSIPLVGVLMESVWTLSEVARFRVSTPSSYDDDFPEEAPEASSKPLLIVPATRKRRPSRDVFESMPKDKEEVWGVCDVVWIHEQQTQDVAVVKIVDAPYVGVEYTAGKCDMTYATSLSASMISKDSNPNTGKVRLMRKDEVCLVTPKTRNTRSPKIMQNSPTYVRVPVYGPVSVSSVVAESSGVRVLWEKPGNGGRLSIVRCSLEGKILSEHLLPIYSAALYGPSGEKPSLLNYGEDSLLLLRDGNGAMVPLVRDAIMGFREPMALNLPPIRHFGMSITQLPSVSGSKAAPSHKAALVSFTAPTPSASQIQLPSIMQHVLFCDTVGVKKILDALEELGDPVRAKNILLNERSDSGCNLIHAAVRLSVASKNKDDVDPGATHGIRLREDGDFSKLSKRDKRKLLMLYETKMARDEARDLDQRWQRLIRANRAAGSEAAAREEPSVIQAAPMQDNVVQSPGDSPKAAAVPQDMPIVNQEQSQAVSDAKERQKKAIEMVAVILEHPVAQPLLFQLLTHRDYGGLTPFQAAVNIRAYGAATSIWEAIKVLISPASPSKAAPPKDAISVQKLVHPSGSRPDDNPLFLLCFNDTCTFTFTGEEHINQDIFECRTCGLTGTLCCCTECAFTCHRNHDCKLKRTSPTAYCDCWEKCPCKALIAGNQDKREALLKELLKHTKLYELNNNRGEHIMLFLARTLGRQQSEQSNSNRRRRHPAPTSHADPSAVPEHDLEPPKFARFALEACINEWPVVRSLIEIGMRPLETMPPSYEDVLCLNSQNGSTHLDKFVFMLMSKCGDQMVTSMIESMIMRANISESSQRDPKMDLIIGRFVRSVLRIYLLLSLMSPTAAATAIRGKSTSSRDTPQGIDRRSFHAIGMSGMFSLARVEPKESKQQLVANVILRCRTVLMSLVPYAVEQTANVADTMLAPVRFGILRPSCSLTLSPNQDCLEAMEKFLNAEFDLTTHLAKESGPHRKRRASRRETESGGNYVIEPSEDDSDSDWDAGSSRRHNSQSMNDTADVGRDTSPQRKTGIVNVLMDDDDESDVGSSSSESDSEDEEPEDHVMVEDDENVDEDEAEEDEHEERFGENSEGEQEERSQNQEDDTQRNENDYPSPTYENSFVAESDSQDASRQEMNEEEERRDGNIADPPAEADEENTRDAVHSEASSVDNSEVRVEPGETGVQQLELRAPPRRADAVRRHRQNLAWTSRLRFDDLEEESAEREGVTTRVTTSSHARAPPSSQNHSGTPASPAEAARRSSSDNTPTVFQTSHQLALAFSFSIRLLCDLLKKFHDFQEDKSISLNWNDTTLVVVMTKVLRRLAPLWDWMYVVLDRLEAQLRFGNAIMLSGATDVRKSSKRRESSGSSAKKDKDEITAADEAPATNSRKETMEYFMATMRGQDREAGDDYPLVDVDTLRTLVFVFDAYLNYHECVITCKKDLHSARSTPSSDVPRETVHRFFQRSNSMCFPGAAVTNAWDTFSQTGSKVPLADKHHLLTPEADLHSLFAPQPSLMTWQEYSAMFKSLGIPQPLNMSLSSHEDEEMEESENEDEEHPAMDISESPDDCRPPSGLEQLTLQEIRDSLKEPMDHPANAAMARWKNVVQFITKECHNELLTAYGGELGQDHLLSTVARFSVRQAMFRKLMDRFRGLQSKDITLEVHRDTVQLIRDAVFQLNQSYVRRQNAPDKNKGRDKEENGPSTVLGSSRVKVRFHDEPGEGTGVARSFYTALAEALHVYRKFPFEELGWEGTSDDYLFGSANQVSFAIQPRQNRTGHGMGSRAAMIRERGSMLARKRPAKRHPLSGDSAIFTIADEELAAAEERVNAGAYKAERASEQMTRTRPLLAEAVFFRVKQLRSVGYARIAGMLVDTPISTMIHCLSSPDVLKNYVDDAVSLLLKVGYPADLAMFSTPEGKPIVTDQEGPHPTSDDSPLFARTCRRGLYAPVPGKLSPMRLNAFRNIGRVIGLSLSQGELFPLKLARHVLKFILNRPIRWLDLQFCDPTVFESMRELLEETNSDEYFENMGLTFTMSAGKEDNEVRFVQLKEGGEDTPVTRENVVEYVYRFVEMKLLGAENVQCYSAIQQGIADVIPLDMLTGLTAEDLRLLMCGTDQVCVATLQAVTTFSDESHAPAETLEKFKQWFWSVVDGLSSLEKQELIFFWTGSPSLPTSPEFLQPQPTVMVRPPDDQFLPTANTCISRLYVPLYSSKKLLRAKLQMAIPNKNFGFV